MARKKKPADDDFDIELNEEPEEVEEFEEPEEFDEPEPVSVDAEPAEPEKPKVGLPLSTLLLFVLNGLAALAFAVLLLLDFQVRQRWSYAVFRHDLALQGLPLREEDDIITASQKLRPRSQLTGEEIKKAHKGPAVAEKFQEVSEILKQRIRPRMLSDSTLQDVFSNVGGQPQRTLEDEAARAQAQLGSDLQTAADGVALKIKDDPARRTLVHRLLLPLAHDQAQIQDLEQRIQKAGGISLEAMLKDAVQRRMLADLVRLLQLYRPWPDEVEETLKLAADPRKVELTKLYDLANQRFENFSNGKSSDGRELESYEKRGNLAFLLTALSELRKTPGGELLYPQGPARAEVAAGFYEYNRAVDTLTALNKRLTAEYQRRIEADREGAIFETGGETKHVQGFVAKYQELVQRILDLVAEIRGLEYSKSRLETQKQRNEQLRDARKQDYEAVVQRLLKSRQETAALVSQLRRMETQLFAAQRELAHLAERNLRLEEEIRKLEIAVGTGATP